MLPQLGGIWGPLEVGGPQSLHDKFLSNNTSIPDPYIVILVNPRR